MKEKLEKIYKNSIFLRIIGLSLNIISAILVLIGVLAIAYNDTLLVEKINFNGAFCRKDIAWRALKR